tara:strand:+ start:17236 stop:19422 length:2187 start_codon:yes stop_codon:yes gene_type:complete
MKYLTFILFLFIGSCSTAPDFDRENENDPTSSEFIPDISNLTVVINSDKTVSLNWSDDTNFEQGFIVSKSFGSDSNFVALDTLQINTEFYRDTSKELDLNTFYKVAALTSNSNKEDLSGISHQLDFGSLTGFESNTLGNEISLSWDSSELFADKFLIEKKQSDSEDWEIVETIDGDLTSYSFNDLNESYLIDLRVSSILEAFDAQLVKLSSASNISIPFNLPSNLLVNVIDEGTIEVNWKDNTPFEEEFVIFQRAASNQYAAGNGEYIPLDTLTSRNNVLLNYYNGFHYDINIAPLKNGILGNTIEPSIVTILTIHPSITNIETISNSEARVFWKDNNYNVPHDFRFPTKRFVFEMSEIENDFEFLKEIEANQNSYTLSDLNPSRNYKIRVRSLSSSYDQTEIGFTSTIVDDLDFNIDSWRSVSHLDITPKGTYFVYEYSHSAGSYGLVLVDSETGQEVENLYFDSDFRGFSFSFDEEFVAIFSGDNPGLFKYTDSVTEPIYSFINIFDEADRIEGVFISMNLLIITDGFKLYTFNIDNGNLSMIEDFNEIDYEYFQIFEVYDKVGDKTIYLETNEGFIAYNFEKESFIIIEETGSYQFRDANEVGEVLFENDDFIFLFSSLGELLLKIGKPEKLEIPYFEFISLNFLGSDLILAGTNYGIMIIFDKESGDYLSFKQVNNGNENIHDDIRHVAIHPDNKRIMTTHRNSNGLSKFYTLNKGWAEISRKN